jgi:hypothetical protein
MAGAPLELGGARGLLEGVFGAECVALGRHDRLGQDTERPVQPSEYGAGAGEVGGEAGVDVLGDAGVEDAALAFEDVEPPCSGVRHGVKGTDSRAGHEAFGCDLYPGLRAGTVGGRGFLGCFGFFFSRLLRC